ncbi:MAG: prepilin-type N-terminal cleavage/methylation domain-containing protein [Candidatus Riflebacteria bacterium]|nr:prepilin-type N-terminal cleavage/methylation domain-containing protein [Candidatus Riflebacteria bacterium]
MKRGFTLLELLLVVAILAILAAAVGPSFLRQGNDAMMNARKDKFINNLNTITLATNMTLLASDTIQQLFSSNTTYTNVYSPAGTTDGLKYLVASSVIQLDTGLYENAQGQIRYFGLAVDCGQTDNPGLPGSYSIVLYSNATTPTIITNGDNVLGRLKTSSAGDYWELIKNQ